MIEDPEVIPKILARVGPYPMLFPAGLLWLRCPATLAGVRVPKIPMVLSKPRRPDEHVEARRQRGVSARIYAEEHGLTASTLSRLATSAPSPRRARVACAAHPPGRCCAHGLLHGQIDALPLRVRERDLALREARNTIELQRFEIARLQRELFGDTNERFVGDDNDSAAPPDAGSADDDADGTVDAAEEKTAWR